MLRKRKEMRQIQEDAWNAGEILLMYVREER